MRYTGITVTGSHKVLLANQPPVWVTSAGSLGNFSEDASINYQLDATDANGDTLSYSVVSGALPAGLSLSSAGVISGTPTAVTTDTTSNFTVSVSDGAFSVQQAFSLTILNVNHTPTWITSAGSLGTYDHESSISITLQANDPDNDSLTYSLTSGSLPAGLSLSSAGVISGLASAVVSDTTSNFTVSVSDGDLAVSRSFSITIHYTAWTLIQTLTSSASFGRLMTMTPSGDTLAVALGTVGSGTSRVYSRSGDTWSLYRTVSLVSDSLAITPDGVWLVTGNTTYTSSIGRVNIYNTSTQDVHSIDPNTATYGSVQHFGSSVAITPDGLTLAIGAEFESVGGIHRGSVYMYTRPNTSSTTWTLQGKFDGSLNSGELGGGGLVITADGNTVYAGQSGGSATGAGSVRKYTRSGSTWTFSTSYTRSGATSQFGKSIAFPYDENTIGVYAPDTSGHVYVGNTSNPAIGTSITAMNLPAGYTAHTSDMFGAAMAGNHDFTKMVVGCPGYDDANSNAGNAFIMKLNGSSYVLEAALPFTSAASKAFGSACAMTSDGTIAIVGAPGATATYIYKKQ
jgi:hypothetical protein